MDELDFRIAPDAAEYLRKYLLRSDTGESLVLTIAPMSSQKEILGGVDPKISHQELAALAKEYLQSLPSPIKLEWIVGGMQRSRLPVVQISLIDGIECFFPDEVRSAVNGRVLRLKLGQLVFDPELDPPSLAQTQRIT
jgi:hypothetical protein